MIFQPFIQKWSIWLPRHPKNGHIFEMAVVYTLPYHMRCISVMRIFFLVIFPRWFVILNFFFLGYSVPWSARNDLLVGSDRPSLQHGTIPIIHMNKFYVNLRFFVLFLNDPMIRNSLSDFYVYFQDSVKIHSEKNSIKITVLYMVKWWHGGRAGKICSGIR